VQYLTHGVSPVMLSTDSGLYASDHPQPALASLRDSFFFFYLFGALQDLHSFPTRRSSDLSHRCPPRRAFLPFRRHPTSVATAVRSEEHTSELQSLRHLVCRLLLEKKKQRTSSSNGS